MDFHPEAIRPMGKPNTSRDRGLEILRNTRARIESSTEEAALVLERLRVFLPPMYGREAIPLTKNN
ncbi:MAG: hypothetical protein AAF514_21625 [Verrucomicrobiota bacterium]